jgi:hypothetical protein
MIPYTDENLEKVKQEIDSMTANYGGTTITEPLKEVIKAKIGNFKKRIFLLTDGQVSQPSQVIDLID